MPDDTLTPRAIVEALDRHVIGQSEAKRKVAIALRNRIRRSRLSPEEQEEITPKNILMMGPTGVGKTEIARRLAKLVDAPFVKVEATRFTEVGYVGRDVESMIRDLVEASYHMVRQAAMDEVRPKAEDLAQERLLDLLTPSRRPKPQASNPFEAFFGTAREPERPHDPMPEDNEDRRSLRRQLEMGLLEDRLVDVTVEENPTRPGLLQIPGAEGMGSVGEMLQGILPKVQKEKRVTVQEARRILRDQEAQRLIDEEAVTKRALDAAQSSGIVFIDEIDKVAQAGQHSGADVSREGVQRDILPIIEGTTVNTKYGPVRTDHILFIAAGAFHVAKPADLIPELQGRFPVRVEFTPLTRDDFRAILVEPESALLKQYQELLRADGVTLHFTDAAIEEMAAYAQRVNEETEDIGARRLHTVAEAVIEDLAFRAPDAASGDVTLDASDVRERLERLVANVDVSRYIL